MGDAAGAAVARDARAVFDAAVRGAGAERLLGRLDWDALLRRAPDAYGAVRVIGAGKAAIAMASVAERILAGRGVEPRGLVVVPHGYAATRPPDVPAPRHVEVVEAGHPVPDEAGRVAAARALALAHAAGPEDLLLVLVSGGGSSLWPAYAEGISVADARATSDLLLRSGATIAEVNTVRKHLSRIGGGRLAEAAHPAEVLALVVSDVVGDDPSVIASGPTVPDATTFADALDVVTAFGLRDALPGSVLAHLTAGAADAGLETVKPGAERLAGATTVVVGGNGDALEAAHAEAERRGYATRVASGALTGEARDAGCAVARAALETARAPGVPPTCLLWGGETTVTVRGPGRGGRNQELALAAALELDAATPHGADVVVLSAGTDGIDGPTDAAGAWVTPHTAAAARAAGIDLAAHLAANDSHPALDALGALLKPGPTHTNVMDVQVAMVR